MLDDISQYNIVDGWKKAASTAWWMKAERTTWLMKVASTEW